MGDRGSRDLLTPWPRKQKKKLRRRHEKETIIKDELIIKLGNEKIAKLGVKKGSVVRQQLRQVARVLESMREHYSLPLTMHDILTPSKYDEVLEAVCKVCVVSEERTLNGGIKYDKPALALKIGQSIKKLALIKEGKAIRDNNEEEQKDAENFLKLH